jgi:hypothetical protein
VLLVGALSGSIGWWLASHAVRAGDPAAGTEVTIRATGEKDARAGASEVWLQRVYGLASDRRIPWEAFEVDRGWERRGDAFGAIDREAKPTLRFRTAEPVRLELVAHSFSGVVELSGGKQKSRKDLFSPEGERLVSMVLDPATSAVPMAARALLAITFALAAMALTRFPLRGRAAWVAKALWFASAGTALYVMLAAAFPGVYTSDTVKQLIQALTGSFGDWHPPWMAWFWSVLIGLTGRVESLLFFHLGLLLLGVVSWAAVFRRLEHPTLASLLPLLLLSPLVLGYSTMVWKDVGFAYALFLASGLVALVLTGCGRAPPLAASAGALLFFAVGIRINGLLAVLPGIAALAWRFLPARSGTLRRAAGVASVSMGCLALVPAGLALHAKAIGTSEEYPFQYVQLYDLAGLTARTGRNLLPGYVPAGRDIPAMREEYRKALLWGNANHLIYPRGEGAAPLPLTTQPGRQRELAVSWRRAIRQEPVAYLAHRFSVVAALMGHRTYPYQLQSADEREDMLREPRAKLGGAQLASAPLPGAVTCRYLVQRILTFWRGSFLYSGWFWLGVLLATAIAGWLRKNAPAGHIMFLLSASGLLYLAPYLVVAPASDFRYLYWCALAGTLAALLGGAGLIRWLVAEAPVLVRKMGSRLQPH